MITAIAVAAEVVTAAAIVTVAVAMAVVEVRVVEVRAVEVRAKVEVIKLKLPIIILTALLGGLGIESGFAYADTGGPSGCPDSGKCTCNAASGVITNRAMTPPFNRWNVGCTEGGPF